jgi:hypothetical protein
MTTEILGEVVRKFGAVGRGILVVAMAVVWYVAHSSAQPGEKMELYFGMISYTIAIHDKRRGANDAANPSPNPCELPWRDRHLECPISD